MRAYVLVGKSSRLPKKHLVEVLLGKRLIDLVVENLQNMGLNVVIYSKIPLNANAPVIEDKSSWILESVCSLFNFSNEFLLFGGDMPMVRKKALAMLFEQLDGKNGVVPRWSDTGYLEPLHAIYTKRMLSCLCNAKSLTKGIENCPAVKFVPAEKMPKETFFNVNTKEDLEKLRSMLSHF